MKLEASTFFFFGEKNTIPNIVKGCTFDFCNSSKVWRTNFLLFETPYGGGASLLLRLLYEKTISGFPLDLYGLLL